MRRHAALLAAVLAAATPPLAAQNARAGDAAAVRRAAESITEADIRRRIGIIADDSMLGRATPSPQLEQVAAWVAGEFARAGLSPAGDSGGFIQRYGISRLRVDSASFVMAMGHGAHGHWLLGREAALIYGQPPAAPLTAPVVLVAGVPADTARPFGDVPMAGTIVLQVLDTSRINNGLVPLVTAGVAAGVKAWLFVSNRSAREFGALAERALMPQYEVGGAVHGPLDISIYEVRDSSAADLLLASGEDPAALLAPGAAPAVHPLSGVTATVDVRRLVEREVSAPNTIGVLEGSDPVLRSEYVFFTGHMDHIGTAGGDEGCRAMGADTICNGADDDGSGAVAVVELAQAFARLSPRPRRSLVFLTVSGEERGLWGSGWYVEHPAVPLAATVADLNTDMIGRNPGDAVLAIGKEHSSLGALADSVAASHPELRMRVLGDTLPRENLFFRSDHYNFARKGVPILFFTTGLHADYHRASDSPDKIDAEQEARIVRLDFYLGLAVADAAARPAWNPDSYRRIVAGAGR
ncbi:MAG TPA: M28 family peptidase [Gemmatimonadales bacterium]|nr:M28 family peptidase [Gemmatimonadales bacterium]